MLKAIETIYNGYRFRSRLEARWAIFFDHLEIEYRYEDEGYVLKDGAYYLPDFYLPTFNSGMYVEVKPKGGDFSLAKQFSVDAGVSIWLAEDVPGFRYYMHGRFDPNMGPFLGDGDWDWAFMPGLPNVWKAYGENRMYFADQVSELDLEIPEEDIRYLWGDYYDAVMAAKQARFEHGETPVYKKPETPKIRPPHPGSYHDVKDTPGFSPMEHHKKLLAYTRWRDPNPKPIESTSALDDEYTRKVLDIFNRGNL